MKPVEAAQQSKRRGRKPSGRNTRTLGVRLYPEELQALERLRAEQENGSLSGLGAALIVEGLERNGLLPKSG